jgi:hypothetical protein
MTFSAVVPVGGYTGWLFLKRTRETQMDLQQAQPQMRRDEAYFRERIGQVRSAEELVQDRRLMKVVLGAFGLDADLANRFFIRKVLEGGVADRSALANRLANRAYREMTEVMGFSATGGPATRPADFADKLLARYNDRQFELAVGEKSNALRLALNAERALKDLAAQDSTEDTKWFTVMGSPPLRSVFETAFGLPKSFAAIDLDQQLGVLKARAERVLGDADISALSDPQAMERLLRRFLVLSGDGAPAASGPAAGALQILQAGAASRSAALRALLA